MLLVLSGFIACENPFTTREPEPPEQNTSNFISPSSPEIVFTNLQIALSERNVENYMRCFVDTTRSDKRFEFVPDQGVATRNPGIFSNWNLESERRYLVQLFQATPKDSTLNLKFPDGRFERGADIATVTQEYAMNIHPRREGENIPTTIAGESKFWLERNETGDWAIYRWEDLANGTDPSWSELKALFQ